MKYIEEIKHMQINIKKQEEKIVLEIDGTVKQFTFNTIDELIESFVLTKKEDFILDAEDETLNYYKALIQNIYDETQKNDFINAYNILSKKDITNEEIIKIIGENQEN